jgi:hypothetical protein
LCKLCNKPNLIIVVIGVIEIVTVKVDHHQVIVVMATNQQVFQGSKVWGIEPTMGVL